MVLQGNGMGFDGKEVAAFTAFKRLHPTGFIVDWMHGGNSLLFYRDGGLEFSDGKRVIDGLVCRVWSRERLGMHERDLHLLADALNESEEGANALGQLASKGMENEL